MNLEGELWKYNFETATWTFIDQISNAVKAMHVSGDRVYMLEGRYNYELGYEQLILRLFDPLLGQAYGSIRWFPGSNRSGTVNMKSNGTLYIGTGTIPGTGGECYSDFWKIGLDTF